MAKHSNGVSFQPFIAGLVVEVVIQLLGHSNRFLALSILLYPHVKYYQIDYRLIYQPERTSCLLFKH